jgi:Mg2+-importing ATPase
VGSHRVHALSVLASQLRSPLLILLAVTALASAFLGQVSDAVIIGVILAASVGMGFVNEYKAAKTAEALHSSVRHAGGAGPLPAPGHGAVRPPTAPSVGAHRR